MSVSKGKSIVNNKLNDYELIKKLLEHNKGYIGKFTEYIFCENVDYKSLEDTYLSIKELKHKSVNIDINGFSYEKLCDEIILSNNLLMVNKVISEFSKVIRTYIKSDIHTYINKLLLLYNSDKKINFISKASRYKDFKTFEDALDIFLMDSDNSKDIVLSKIPNLISTKIVYNSNDILILYIKDRRDMVILGSDTSWCIVNSEYNWKSYTKNRHQFIIYNYNLDVYSKDFKTGFTLDQDFSIHASHNILDNWNSSYLSELLIKYSIDLSKNIEIMDDDIIDVENMKISKTTSYANLEKYVKNIPRYKLVDTINKIIKFERTDTFKIKKIISIALKGLYPGDDIIDVSEFDKFDKRLVGMYIADSTPMAERIVSLDIDYITYMGNKRIIYLLDKYDFTGFTFSKVKHLLEYPYRNVSDDVKELVFKKVLECYETTMKYIDDPNIKYYYELSLLILSKYSKNGFEYYDEIVNNLKYNHIIECIKYLRSDFKLKLQPDNNGDINYYKDIKYVIPHDYTNLLITSNNNNLMSDMCDRFTNNFLSFKISEYSLKQIVSCKNHRSGYYTRGGKLYDMLISLKKKKEITNGNIHIKVIK